MQTARRWVAQLLLFAFVFRAFVPAGYMADFSAAARGAFKMVICSSSSSTPISIDLGEDGQPKKPGQHAGDECAFAGLASLALPDLEIAQAARHDYAAVSITLPLAVVMPPVRAGPALGARAPPNIS